MIGKILLHNGKNLMGLDIAIKIGRFSVQSLLGAWPGIGIQPCYKAPGDLRVKIAKTQWLTSGEWDFPPYNGTKMAVGSQTKLNKIRSK